MNSESKHPAQQRARRARVGGRSHKIAGSDFPKFLVRLVGWRKVRQARTEPRLPYRHD